MLTGDRTCHLCGPSLVGAAFICKASPLPCLSGHHSFQLTAEEETQDRNPAYLTLQLLPVSQRTGAQTLSHGRWDRCLEAIPPVGAPCSCPVETLTVPFTSSASGWCSHHSGQETADSEARGRMENAQGAPVTVFGL